MSLVSPKNPNSSSFLLQIFVPGYEKCNLGQIVPGYKKCNLGLSQVADSLTWDKIVPGDRLLPMICRKFNYLKKKNIPIQKTSKSL